MDIFRWEKGLQAYTSGDAYYDARKKAFVKYTAEELKEMQMIRAKYKR